MLLCLFQWCFPNISGDGIFDVTYFSEEKRTKDKPGINLINSNHKGIATKVDRTKQKERFMHILSLENG